MSEYPLELRARALARRGLAGHKRKQGDPAFNHAQGVVDVLKRCGITDPTIIAAGYGHDLFEDTWIDYDYVTSVLEEEVANIIDVDTRRDGELRSEYLKRIYFGGIKAQLVKLADVAHNISCIIGATSFPISLDPQPRVLVPRFSLPLKLNTVERVLGDYDFFYLPLARRIHWGLYSELHKHRMSEAFMSTRHAQVVRQVSQLQKDLDPQLVARLMTESGNPELHTTDPKQMFPFEDVFLEDDEIIQFELQETYVS